MTVAYQTIVMEVDAGVALVTLNRPEQLNAFTPTMGRELGHAFVNLEADETVRAIVVTGAGRAFCSGAALDPAGSTFRGGSDEKPGPERPGGAAARSGIAGPERPGGAAARSGVTGPERPGGAAARSGVTGPERPGGAAARSGIAGPERPGGAAARSGIAGPERPGGGAARSGVTGPPLSELSPWTMATPVIAAINGAAIGLGITYPMQWDIRVAAEEARIGFAFTRRGLLPEANSLWLLSRLVGASRALDLLLTGRTITGAAAAEMGLVSQALPAAGVLDAALDIARDIAVNTAPASVAITKQLFYEQLGSTDRISARSAERAAFTWLASRPDAREGINAFLERRPPAWGMSKHTPIPDSE